MSSLEFSESMEEIGRRSIPATLTRLMTLTNDAVFVFEGSGKILYANTFAHMLLGTTFSLSDYYIQNLFWSKNSIKPAYHDFSGDNTNYFADEKIGSMVGFAQDGTLSICNLGMESTHPVCVSVRCDKVSSPGNIYLLVAQSCDKNSPLDWKGRRLVAELRQANHRLSGTLNIVLDTLNAQDVASLFTQVLEEITDTMEASGTIVYLADKDGFHLQGATQTCMNLGVPGFLSYDRVYDPLSMGAQSAVRFHLLPPSKLQLMEGPVKFRDIVDEETGESHKIYSYLLPPFKSFISVPVWFGGHIVALIMVGWTYVHPISRDDARLMDAVAQYLSVQIVGALKTLRQERVQRLNRLESQIHDRLSALPSLNQDSVLRELQVVCKELRAYISPIKTSKFKDATLVDLPFSGISTVPQRFCNGVLAHNKDEVRIISVVPQGEFSSWLESRGEPCQGVLVDAGEVFDAHQAFLVLREETREPLEDIEISFLYNLGFMIRELAEGLKARQQDKRISQALQTGMKNVLQEVEGITSTGIYSSATADAFVGGDFYDLIRLDKHRACVIMGDVSGKGVEAASVSAAVKTALAAYAWTGLKPAQMVRTLNKFLLGFSRLETFATLFVGIIDLDGKKMEYCSAGHPPALLYRKEQKDIDSLDVQSGVVGAFEEMQYRSGQVSFDTGDILFLYTDGVTEARDTMGAFFGERGLREAVLDEAEFGVEHILDKMLARLDRFTSRHLDDDVAMLALRFD